MTVYRYSIMVRESGADHDTELAACNSNPEPLVKAAREKRFGGRRRIKVYEDVYVVDRGEPQ